MLNSSTSIKKNYYIFLNFLFWGFGLGSYAYSQAWNVPKFIAPVNDYAQIVDSRTEQTLNRVLNFCFISFNYSKNSGSLAIEY